MLEECSELPVPIKGGPDFLVIGAQKAGTTWIYRYLSQQPGVKSLPVKELHFFDEAELRCKGRVPVSFQYRKRNALRKAIVQTLRTANSGHLRWALKYVFTKRALTESSIRHYAQLFDCADIVGDITPAYATLSENTIAKIHRAFPSLRVVFVLRNPIDRLWSATRMHFFSRGYKNISNLDESALIEHFDVLDERNEYLSTIKKWRKYFSEERFLVAWYDELSREPAKFGSTLSEFLGVESVNSNSILSERHNVGLSLEMSPRVELYLLEKFHESLGELAESTIGYDTYWPNLWRESCVQRLEALRKSSAIAHG